MILIVNLLTKQTGALNGLSTQALAQQQYGQQQQQQYATQQQQYPTQQQQYSNTSTQQQTAVQPSALPNTYSQHQSPNFNSSMAQGHFIHPFYSSFLLFSLFFEFHIYYKY